MTSAFLIALFLHNFSINSVLPSRAPTYRELRRSERAGVLNVEVLPVTGGTISPGASRVKMLDLKMKASCNGNVSLKSITLIRKGAGDYRDIKRVYALYKNKRLGPSMPMSRRNGIVRLRIRSFSIPKCKTRTVAIFADFSGSASAFGEHRFILSGAKSILATASSISIIRRNDSIRRKVNRTVAGKKSGKISVIYLPLTKRITYGRRRTFLRFLIKADGIDDHRINAITLKNRGTAKKLDLQNLYLPGSRVQASLEGDTVRFVFDPPLILKKNQERLMILRGDVRASRRRTIDFIIEEPSDIESEVIRMRLR